MSTLVRIRDLTKNFQRGSELVQVRNVWIWKSRREIFWR
jgi:hypothetical protein